MIRAKVTMPMGPFRDFQRHAIQRLEAAALIATDQASRRAVTTLRQQMRGAGLGRLGGAIGATSDLKKNGRVHRRATGFSASGVLYIRSKSERALGAIDAYTEGAEIRPKKGGWLWIATPEIPSRVARFRMTPARYNAGGYATKIGPLVAVPGRHPNEMLLIVRKVTVSRSGRRGSALSRKSRVAPSREERDFIVAFVGIRRTSRAARVDVRAIVQAVQAEMPALIAAALGRN